MSKLICFVIGHNYVTNKCPVTEASKTICLRCSVKDNHSVMSFR
jgi:hypothetical protein